MRKLLLLALLLYDILLGNGVEAKASPERGYDELDKRHLALEDRRNYRKQSLAKNILEATGRDWEVAEDPKRYAYDTQHRLEEFDKNTAAGYKTRKHYDDIDRSFNAPMRSSEISYYDRDILENNNMRDKDAETKISMINCDREHERFESCFAGCASVTCDNPRERLRPCYPFCEQGCICVPPYVRDDRTHKCVLPEECTKGLKGIPDLNEPDEIHL